MKILLAYAYAGIGHKKAAEALQSVLSEYSKVELTAVDALDYTNTLFKFLYPRVYLFLINRTPFLWGVLYYLVDLRALDAFLAPARRFFHNIHAKRFIRFVLEKNPDAAICTHFLPAEVVSGLKRKNKFSGKLITIVTDFLPHSFWMAGSSDYFIGAIERTKKDLVKRGIEEERVKVLGIPCEPKFGISGDHQALIKKLGLHDDLFNLLIMGGGFGTGPVKKIVNAIYNMESRIRDALQVIVICGKNKKLFEELNRKKLDSNVKLYAFGYMDNIDEFMEVADCIITKSGGLTVSESLSKKLPMIIIQPIPGQETRNCKILTGYGTAVRANTVGQAKNYVKEFMLSPEKILGMRARIKFLSYPDAAKNIAKFVVGKEGAV